MSTHPCIYIDEDLILFINSSNKEAVLQLISDTISLKTHQSFVAPQQDFIYMAINQREKLMSTGIGMGVAIPHAKISGFPTFCVAVAILQQGVEWDAIDSSLVRLVFMIIGPDDQPAKYLSILSKLTNLIRSDITRKELLNSASKKAVFCFLQEEMALL